MLEKLKILIIEDDVSFALILKGCLSVLNMVSVVHSFKAAQSVITQDKFDLCLLDKTLQDGNGLELAASLKNNNPHCVIIVLTGDPDYGPVVKAIALGIDDYLVKSEYVIADLHVRYMIAKSNLEKKLIEKNKRNVPPCILPKDDLELTPAHFDHYLKIAEKEYIIKALGICAGDLIRLSRKLGVSRSTLFNKFYEYKIKYRNFQDTNNKENILSGVYE